MKINKSDLALSITSHYTILEQICWYIFFVCIEQNASYDISERSSLIVEKNPYSILSCEQAASVNKDSWPKHRTFFKFWGGNLKTELDCYW